MRIADCGLRNDPDSDSELSSPEISDSTSIPRIPLLFDPPNSEIPCGLQDPQSAIASASSNSEIRNPKSEIVLASSFELEGMYRHLSEVLQLMDFLDKQNPELWMMSLRRYFSRTGLQSHEVRMIRGVCRQLKWFITRYRPQPEPPQMPDTER